jgi:hypothetical protein
LAREAGTVKIETKRLKEPREDAPQRSLTAVRQVVMARGALNEALKGAGFLFTPSGRQLAEPFEIEVQDNGVVRFRQWIGQRDAPVSSTVRNGRMGF